MLLWYPSLLVGPAGHETHFQGCALCCVMHHAWHSTVFVLGKVELLRQCDACSKLLQQPIGGFPACVDAAAAVTGLLRRPLSSHAHCAAQLGHGCMPLLTLIRHLWLLRLARHLRQHTAPCHIINGANLHARLRCTRQHKPAAGLNNIVYSGGCSLPGTRH